MATTRGSTGADVSAATVVTSEGSAWKIFQSARARVETFSGASQTPREVRMGCGSLCKYAAVALIAQVFVQHPPLDYALKGKRSMVWDHAAGIVCAAEAGATVTDLRGGAVRLGDGETGGSRSNPAAGGYSWRRRGYTRGAWSCTRGAQRGRVGQVVT